MTPFAQNGPRGNSRRTNSDADALMVAEWAVNQREIVRVSIEQYKDTWLVNCRKWFESENGELRPSRRGIALSVRNLPRLAAAFANAVSIGRERGLIGGGE
jgi:Transcriptional Coactivator p15 (PC4)